MFRSRFRWMLTAALCLPLAGRSATAWAAEPFPKAESVRSALSQELLDVNGRSQQLENQLGKRGTVLAFLSTECPISNGYIPALNRMHEQFQQQGIVFIGINSNDPQTRESVAAHVKKFDIRFPMLKDERAIAADKLGIETCPMVLVLDERQKPVYQGRIDDRYTRRGGGAREVRRADLEVALEELLAGKPISTPQTEPVGCPLLTNDDRAEARPTTAAVTYSEHISRLLQKHCQECHRPNAVGPFSLMTYADAVSWAKDLKTFTANRTMPPWQPKSGHERFENPRVLTDEEIRQVADWVDNGTPEGDPKLLPEPKTFHDGWKLGQPDLVLTPSESYTLGAEGQDEFRCFVIPTNYAKDLHVKAIEVLPGSRAVVHHVLVFLDASGKAAELDAKDPAPGYATTAGFPGFLPSGGLGGWAPGNSAEFLPDGIANLVPRGSAIVMQLHYHRSGKVEDDQTQLGLYLAKEPINRLTRGLAVLPYGPPHLMRIPAGEKRYEVKGGFELQQDVLLLGITPHMHLLGQDMTVTAKRPDGTEETVIDTRWNFNWQESYRFREPLLLPKGTVLQLVAHFDNSADNPYNPNHPPKLVKWGEQTKDEMCIAFLEVTSPRPANSPEELKPINPREEIRDGFIGRFKADRKRRLENSPLRRFLPQE